MPLPIRTFRDAKMTAHAAGTRIGLIRGNDIDVPVGAVGSCAAETALTNLPHSGGI